MLLNEEQVNIPELVKLFNSAFIDTEDGWQGSFRVKLDSINVQVSLDADVRFITYNFHNRLNNISLLDASTVTNIINNEYRMIKCCAAEVEGNVYVIMTYSMSYKKGIIKYHLIDNIKLFEKISVEAVIDRFNDYL